MQIWPCHNKIKGQSRIILVDFKSPMMFTKIQPQSFHGSGEVGFKCFFLPYMGMVDILFKPFEQIDNTHSTESQMWNAVSKKKTFKDYDTLYMYIAQG